MTAGQSEQLKARFLGEFAKQGNVSRACKVAKVGRTTVYDWRSDAEFDRCYHEAELAAVDVLEAEAWKRAVTGRATVKRKFAPNEVGELVQVEEERAVTVSDGLLTLLLKARAPERYRERMDIKHQQANDGDADELDPATRDRIRRLLIGDAGDRGDVPAAP